MTDRTVVMPGRRRRKAGAVPRRAPPLHVSVDDGGRRSRFGPFQRKFRVGRHPGCDVCIDSDRVSREHVEVSPDGGQWRVRDLGSTNGTFVEGAAIYAVPVAGSLTLMLGTAGPLLSVDTAPPREAAAAAPKPAAQSVEALVDEALELRGDASSQVRARELRERLLKATAQGSGGHARTLMALAGLVFSVVIGVGLFLGVDIYRDNALRADAEAHYARMRSLELTLAELEGKVRTREERAAYQRALAELEAGRDITAQFRERFEQRELFDAEMSVEDRLILRVARYFGESEFSVPPDFASEVKKYIGKWQSSPRYANAMRRLHENDYAQPILTALDAQGLPPHFIYLALQESNFDVEAIGPPTNFGRAKGMWQFIPGTAKAYGLEVGRFANDKRVDPADERFDFAKSTDAAARYLKFIYTTEAQASGLLVMASYNWGERRVIKRLRKMSPDPTERNFWNLRKQHWIPEQTDDYVLHIFSAAVIGEDPRHFGFDFDSPLG